MTPPTQQELQDALDDLNTVSENNESDFFEVHGLHYQVIKSALKFTMAANKPNNEVIDFAYGIGIRHAMSGNIICGFFKAMTAKIWEGIE